MNLTGRHTRQGFSLIELLIVVAIIFVVAGIVSINYKSSRLTSVETAVIVEMRTIHQAQMLYLSQYGEFATTLAQLGPPVAGLAGPHAAGLIPANLASGTKNGYVFILNSTSAGYTINASPKIFGANGRRTFFLDDAGVIHQNWGPEPATAQHAAL